MTSREEWKLWKEPEPAEESEEHLAGNGDEESGEGTDQEPDRRRPGSRQQPPGERDER